VAAAGSAAEEEDRVAAAAAAAAGAAAEEEDRAAADRRGSAASLRSTVVGTAVITLRRSPGLRRQAHTPHEWWISMVAYTLHRRRVRRVVATCPLQAHACMHGQHPLEGAASRSALTSSSIRGHAIAADHCEQVGESQLTRHSTAAKFATQPTRNRIFICADSWSRWSHTVLVPRVRLPPCCGTRGRRSGANSPMQVES
jgi:hypothetical protein